MCQIQQPRLALKHAQKAGFASNKALPQLTAEGFMESMRINALS
jgi:hypothetical protein